MNERLLELYKQARVPDTFIDPSNNMPCETTSFSAEKFAELIIQECIDQSKKEADRYYRLDMLECATAMQNFKLLIKEHFGVK